MLEQAQAAGQKTQQDALIGQGSIFDLGRRPEPAARAAPGARLAPVHPPIPGEEFEQRELLAARRKRSACSSPRTR